MHISLDSALGQQRRLNQVGESITQIAPNSTAAYSLRSLTGGDPKVVRVRRDTGGGAGDNDEEDFTVSGISSGALVDFVGSGNDGFVETWYDQSGNGRDATQATAANQPKIVNAGSLVSNGLDFDGVNDQINMPTDIISNVNSVSVFLVSKGLSGVQFDPAVTISSSPSLIINYLFATFIINKYGGSNLTLASTDGAKHLVSFTAGGENAESFFDGTSKGTVALQSGYSASTIIGSFAFSFFQGQIEELIIYDNDQRANRVALETNIQTAYPTLP